MMSVFALSAAERTEDASFHVLDFSWDGFVPRLEAYDAGSGTVVMLPLDVLDMTVSSERECIGSFDRGYRPCPARRPVGRFVQCRSCMGDWADVRKCVFEPQCTGDGCVHGDFCGRRHVVYLAAYGTLVKVGMTSATRLLRRGIEQGADAIVPVLMCRDRQEARHLEKEVSKRLRLPQEIRAGRIAAQWTHPPSRDVIENSLATHRLRIASWHEVMDEEVVHLDGYPMHAHPPAPPAVAEVAGRHAGAVLGIKGRYMIYRHPDGESWMLDLSDLPSRTVIVSPASRDEVETGARTPSWTQTALDLRTHAASAPPSDGQGGRR